MSLRIILWIRVTFFFFFWELEFPSPFQDLSPLFTPWPHSIRGCASPLNLSVFPLHCCCSVTKSCLTLCDPMDCHTPGSPVLNWNKTSEGDGIPAELFQILKDDAVKVLHSICQQIWKTWQCPQDWKRLIFIPIPKKSSAKECSNYLTIVLFSHAVKVMLKILQARLQQYMNWELTNVSWF